MMAHWYQGAYLKRRKKKKGKLTRRRELTVHRKNANITQEIRPISAGYIMIKHSSSEVFNAIEMQYCTIFFVGISRDAIVITTIKAAFLIICAVVVSLAFIFSQRIWIVRNLKIYTYFLDPISWLGTSTRFI